MDKPLSMPFWHRRIPDPKPAPHEHKWDEQIDAYDITTDDGRKVGVYYVKKCSGCGEIRQFNTGVRFFQ